MNSLLETIEENGEFEKYITLLANRQEKEQREVRKRVREMKRISMGDKYQSSASESSELDQSNWSESESEG